jgi:hypothetical protein
MFESLASCFAFRCSASLNMTPPLRTNKVAPGSFPAGPLSDGPNYRGRCDAAGAGAAGAATAAACVTGRDCRRRRHGHNCCSRQQIFHDSLLLRFRESSNA